MKNLALLPFLIALASCSNTPVVYKDDNFNQAQYEASLAQCKEYAKQVKGQTSKGALGGAIVGGLIGLITGDAGDSAAIGGIVGGADGTAKKNAKRDVVVRNCLRQEGYKILD